MLNKRLKKELSRLDNYEVINEKKILFNNIIQYPITFVITQDYPFRGPQVIIENIDYIETLRCQFYQEIKEISDSECLCCDSLTCPNNWNVTNKIIDLIDEIKYNFSLKKRSIERYIAKRIIKKFYLPNVLLRFV